MPLHVRVFVASPNDLDTERVAIYNVLNDLTYDPLLVDKVSIRIVSWDGPRYTVPLLATIDPQKAVQTGLPLPSECDIVVCMLWKRIGTSLGDTYVKADGSPCRSGTEWEYYEALEGFKRRSFPHVLVYRKVGAATAPVSASAAQLGDLEGQSAQVEDFFVEMREQRRGFQTFESVDQLIAMFTSHTKLVLSQLLESGFGRANEVKGFLAGAEKPPATTVLIAFASDRLNETQLRVLTVTSLVKLTNWEPEEVDLLVALSRQLLTEPIAELGIAGVVLAHALFVRGVINDLELFDGAAMSSSWEVQRACIRVMKEINDPIVLPWYALVAGKLGYHVTIQAIIRNVGALVPKLTGAELNESDAIVARLRTERTNSKKTVAMLDELAAEIEQRRGRLGQI